MGDGRDFTILLGLAAEMEPARFLVGGQGVAGVERERTAAEWAWCSRPVRGQA
jgi:hypothetical protein